MTFEAPKTWEEWKNERSAREQRHFCLGVFTYLCKVGTTNVERYFFQEWYCTLYTFFDKDGIDH